MSPPPETLNALLERAESFPDTGLRFLDRRLESTWHSWGDLYRRSLEVASSLGRLGVERGERVALVYPTCPDFFHAFFGILLAGAVPVPLYPPVRLGRLDEYHRRTAAMLSAVEARLVLAEGRVQRILGPTIADAAPKLGCKTLARLPAATEVVSKSVGAEDLALLQFSSGTTAVSTEEAATPKPVALSHRAVLAQVRALNAFWPATGLHPTGVSWLPLYHDMGLIGCIFTALELPSVMTLLPPEVFVVRPATWLKALSTYGASISVAPNFAYGLCVEKVRDEDLEGVDLSSWRVALNGAEAVAPAVLRAFQERFAPYGFQSEALTPVYGLSEASLAVTFGDLERDFRSRRFDRDLLAGEGIAERREDGLELVSVGRPLPGFEVRVDDEDGKRLEAGRVGQIWVRGPSLMDGYLGRPEATAEVLRDDWLDTGDLGFLDDGELYLTGRAKDLVILRGRNYAPTEIEQAVAEVAGARKGCAVAVSWLPEGASGEVLLLFVETVRDIDAETFAELPSASQDAVLAATGLRVDEVHPLAPGTLPRTSSGKLRRAETLARHRAGRLDPPKKVGPVLLTGAFARSALAYARARKRDKKK